MKNLSFLYSFLKNTLAIAFCASTFLSHQALATLIDFDGLADLEVVTNQYDGVIFSGATVLTAGLSLNDFEFPPASGDNVVYDVSGPIEILFDIPVFNVSGLFTYATLAGLTATAYGLDSSILDTATSAYSSNMALSGDPGSSANELIELSSTVGIARVVIEGGLSGGSFTLDNLSYTNISVPEPPVIVLMLTGLLLLVVKRLVKENTTP